MKSGNWRVWWKKGIRIFTQNWTLSETLQISHAVLFTWVKQCSACIFPEVCFLFEILCMRKTHFSKAILWGPFVEQKTKEAFCFAKPWSQYNTWISYYCFVSTSGWGAEQSGLEFVLSWRRLDTRWRSVQFFFLCRSLSLHFSKPKISIYLRVFVIELPFLITWRVWAGYWDVDFWRAKHRLLP